MQGEVYEIDQPTLARLDFLMNHGTAFTRRMVDVEMENREILAAEVYVWNGRV